MYINQDSSKFQPIHITLESETELRNFLQIINNSVADLSTEATFIRNNLLNFLPTKLREFTSK